ncbi:MAG: hypothetical protein WC732_09220 [Candidatus Omnitrophota bacterium]
MIKERDGDECAGSVHVVEMAQNVRMAISAVCGAIEELVAHEKVAVVKCAESATIDPAVEARMRLRAEVLDVMTAHLEECVALERKRYDTHRPASEQIDPTVTRLPDLDDPRFAVLHETDHKIDALLDSLATNVGTLKEVAIDIRAETKTQSAVLDALDVEVVHADARVTNLGHRVKDVLEQIRPPTKFVVDAILVCLLLGVGGVLYSVLKSRL